MSLEQFKLGMKEGIIIVFSVVMFGLTLSINTRVNDLEFKSGENQMHNQRIEKIEQKMDELIQLSREAQKAQTEFYKEYSPALEYSKRQLYLVKP